MSPGDDPTAEPSAPREKTRLPRLLLIDDDVKLTRLLSSYLAGQGFDVSAVHDGASGLQIAQYEDWDLIILDGMLPLLDGIEVLRQLRAKSRVPIVMLTARSMEENRIIGLDEGADDYLPKTVSPRELTSRIKAVLRRAQPLATAPRVIVIGGLRVDLDARAVTVDGIAVALTRAEFDLLAALASGPGKVYSREALGRQLGMEEFDPQNRSLDVHVTALRKKLGDDPRHPRYLRTVRGAGYQIVKPDQT